ncbi:metal ABC transporter solute-binding protein, Zn/Mn family [uncultured Roseibium sp.]|uniref:metal ABC transporter solute-binding protein, Zn/Mn family n=1 Tax=uncultured Roseibium sp. TaxID=1936171 RepID=UPI003217A93B
MTKPSMPKATIMTRTDMKKAITTVPMDLNPHIWLDPENARAMVKDIAIHLSEADPDNAATYKAKR